MFVDHFVCHAAVDLDAFTGNEGISRIGQEQTGACDIVALADAAAPVLFMVYFAEFLAACMDPAGRYGVDADAAFAQCGSQ